MKRTTIDYMENAPSTASRPKDHVNLETLTQIKDAEAKEVKADDTRNTGLHRSEDR